MWKAKSKAGVEAGAMVECSTIESMAGALATFTRVL